MARSAADRRRLLQSMAQAGQKKLPAAWAAPVARVLGAGDEAVLPVAVAVVRTMPAEGDQAAELRDAPDRGCGE